MILRWIILPSAQDCNADKQENISADDEIKFRLFNGAVWLG